MKDNYITNILFLNSKSDLEIIIESKKAKIPYISENYDSSITFKEGINEFENIDQQLIDYLNGNLIQFNISYILNTTPFIKKVLEETSKISSGKVRTYKEIAERIGNPKAYRAVGNALASNPIPIIIPCHRVIKNNGRIGGFGGNPELKKKLLIHEGAL